MAERLECHTLPLARFSLLTSIEIKKLYQALRGFESRRPDYRKQRGGEQFFEFGGYLPFRIFRICVNRKSITETMAFRWLDIAGDNEKLASYLD